MEITVYIDDTYKNLNKSDLQMHNIGLSQTGESVSLKDNKSKQILILTYKHVIIDPSPK